MQILLGLKVLQLFDIVILPHCELHCKLVIQFLKHVMRKSYTNEISLVLAALF